MPRKPKRSTWGCVEQARPGVWRIRYQADTGDGRGYARRSETVHGTRREAHARLAELRAKYEREPDDPRRRRGPAPTCGEVYERRYLPAAVRKLRSRSLKNVESVWERWAKPRWGDVPVTSVTAGDYQEWLLMLPKTICPKASALGKEIMRLAVLDGAMDSSPLDVRFDMSDIRTKAHDSSTIPGASLGDYLAAVHGRLCEPAAILGACGGLRVGESIGAMVGEVSREEVDAGGVPVTVALYMVAREVREDGTIETAVVDGEEVEALKTDRSRRWAVVVQPWAERLLDLQGEAAERGWSFIADNGFGRPLSMARVRADWYRALKDAGLPKITLQNLRPTFATQAGSSMGFVVEDVARLMGHSTPSITYKIYQRPQKDDIIASVSRALSG